MMKNLIAITCFVVALVSCNKVEHKLEGKWQLKTVEANGVVQTVDTVWYNFQTSLFEYQLYDRQRTYIVRISVIRRWREIRNWIWSWSTMEVRLWNNSCVIRIGPHLNKLSRSSSHL